MDGITYEEFEKNHPIDFKLRAENKLKYRYPMGESYIDIIERIEPIIFEIERSRHPVIVVFIIKRLLIRL